MAFGWAAIHGAGPAALLAFVPTALGVGILWVGYGWLRRQRVRNMTITFALLAVVILLINELVLPSTPLQAWRSERRLEKIVVRNIRDEVFLTRRGNPIGIRITFDATVPQTGAYFMSHYVLTPVDNDVVDIVRFGTSLPYEITPTPRDREEFRPVLQKNVVYTFTIESLPNFASYDGRTKEPCLRDVNRPPYFSEADLLPTLSKSRNVRYRSAIEFDAGADAVVVAEYVTSHGYDLEAMYQTIVTEGIRRCGS